MSRCPLLLATAACALLASPAARAVTWEEALAANRPAAESVLPAEDAAGAVDGLRQGFGMHTDNVGEPWWSVDLAERQALDRVAIHAPHSSDRLEGFVVETSDDGREWRLAWRHEGAVAGDFEVALGGAEARFLRIRVPRSTWMHLSEVEVYPSADPTRNIALGKPADQSSVSQWSVRHIELPRAGDSWESDSRAARGALEPLLARSGDRRTALTSRLGTLLEARTPVTEAAWRDLHTEAQAAAAEWDPVLAQWPLVDLDALARAARRLRSRFPERLADEATRTLEWIEGLRPRWESLGRGVAQGEPEALREARQIVDRQRSLLLANPLLDFDRMLVLRRDLGARARAAMGAELGVGSLNAHTSADLPRRGWSNELAVLSDLRGEPRLETLFRPTDSAILADPDLDFDAGRVLFASVGGAENAWRLFEIALDGGGLAQVTPDDGADISHFDGCWLPDGDVIFASTASYQGLPCEYGGQEMVCLYRLDRRSGRIRQLTFEQDSDWCPTILPDGRVLYQRWEYADLPHSNSRILFRMNPDGTQQQEYYGSGSYFPASLFHARPVPGDASRIVGVAGGHHGTPRSGRLLLIDPGLGQREAEGVIQEVPGWGRAVEPIVRDRLVDGVWPQFLQPWPLSDEEFLVAMKPSEGALWGIWLADIHDNLTLIREVEDAALLEPIALAPRERPPVLPDRTSPGRRDATVYIADIHAGPGLAGVPRGAVKRLRIGSYYFSSRGTGGLLGSIGMDGPWDIKRVLGTVPVAEDGSASFHIPANTPIFLQPLDEQGQALQLMRSWFVGMPGEVVTCAGCHEPRGEAVAGGIPVPARAPVEIDPWAGHGPVHGFRFVDDVQPTLDLLCLGCHDGGATSPAPDLRGTEYIRDWSSQISGNAGAGSGGNFSVSYANLHRYVRQPGIESDLAMLAPGEFGADTTELLQILRSGRHHGVVLGAADWDSLVTWIDLNAPFHGTWGEVAPRLLEHLARVGPRRRELSLRYAGIDTDYEAIPPREARVATAPPPPAPAEASPAERPSLADWPFDAAGARERQGADAERTVDLGEGQSLTLRRIPAGSYAGERGARSVECAFWMATCETSNALWRLFEPDRVSRDEDRHGYQFGRKGYDTGGAELPVTRVSFEDAQRFAAWLSERTGLRFRLPSEDEWEWACRAGSETDFWWGGAEADWGARGNLGDKRLAEYAACTAQGNYTEAVVLSNPSRYDDWVPHDERVDDGSFLASPVGAREPNPWGLRDMHGNVWEWTDSEREPGRKVVRGGSWYWRPKWATSSSWIDYRPWQGVFDVGFRLVCEE